MIVVVCEECRRWVGVNEETLVYQLHWNSMVGVPCRAVGKVVSNTSRIPSWHNQHVCGMYCDGQDGPLTSRCGQIRRRGPPSAVERLAELSKLEGRMGLTDAS